MKIDHQNNDLPAKLTITNGALEASSNEHVFRRNNPNHTPNATHTVALYATHMSVAATVKCVSVICACVQVTNGQQEFQQPMNFAHDETM